MLVLVCFVLVVVRVRDYRVILLSHVKQVQLFAHAHDYEDDYEDENEDLRTLLDTNEIKV